MSESTEADVYDALSPFLDALKSSAPSPGGGAVAGLCGALAAALTHMVAALTVGKKNYASVDGEFRELMVELDRGIGTFFDLAKRDALAFDAVMAAFKLPKDSDSAKAERSRRIKAAAAEAVEVPFAVISNCRALLGPMTRAAHSGNSNVVSDAGVAAYLVEAAVKSAALNVRVNLPLLDEELRRDVPARLESETSAVLDATRRCASIVDERIANS